MNQQYSYSKTDLLQAALGAAVSMFLFLPLFVYATNLSDVEISKLNILFSGTVLTLTTVLCLYLLFHIPRAGNWLVRLCQLAVFLVLVLNVFPNHTGELSGFEAGATTPASHLPALKLLVLAAAGGLWAWRRPGQLTSAVNALTGLIVAVCILMVGAPILIFKIVDWTTKSDLAWMEKLMPWGWKYDLLSHDIGTRLLAIAVMLGFTALFMVLGLRGFGKRDL